MRQIHLMLSALAISAALPIQAAGSDDIVKLCMSVHESDLLDTSQAVTTCAGYVGGFLDGQVFRTLSSGMVAKGSEVNRSLGYCFRPNVTTGQLVLVFKKYLLNHPETLDHPPSVLLNDALQKSFPCK